MRVLVGHGAGLGSIMRCLEQLGGIWAAQMEGGDCRKVP